MAVPIAAADVTMTYRPHCDGLPDPGEVVWTWGWFDRVVAGARQRHPDLA